jgi:hypothetical protein
MGSGSADDVVGNFVPGSIGFSGAPAECRYNMRFTDADEDGFLDEIEADAAEALGCEG